MGGANVGELKALDSSVGGVDGRELDSWVDDEFVDEELDCVDVAVDKVGCIIGLEYDG